MNYVRFGKTGLQVSRVCLGTMTFGFQCDEEASFAILNEAQTAGITFFDTSDSYPSGGTVETTGTTESIIGKWLKGKRSNFIVGTKCWAQTGTFPWQQGTSRKHVLDAIDASLKRLGTDYVDLYQVHHDDENTPMDETLEAMDTVVRTGRARYIGCSNFNAWRLAKALGRSEILNISKYSSVQPRYNLIFREFERDLLPLAIEDGLAVISYNPLAGGLLTGKHEISGGPPQGSRFTLGTAGKMYTDRYWHEKEFETIARLNKLAKENGTTLTTLAIAWVLANKAITCAILGASKPEHLIASVAGSEYKIDPLLMKEIQQLTHQFRMGDSSR